MATAARTRVRTTSRWRWQVRTDNRLHAEKTSLDDLASFIRQLRAETLSSVLIELAAAHATVHERLVRLQLSNQPKALATVFRKWGATIITTGALTHQNCYPC